MDRMQRDALVKLANDWDEQTHTVLELKPLSLDTLHALLKETYRALSACCQDDLVPKEISHILLGIDEFLFFTAMMEDKERGLGFYHWEELHVIFDALKKGFFAGKYDHVFPALQVADVEDNTFLIDFEKNHFADFVVMFQQVKAQEP